MAELPLEGIRVIDSGDALAGPFTCTILGDWGAEVIKVEAIQHFSSRGQLSPPPQRPAGVVGGMWNYPDGIPGQRPWNRVGNFNSANRNKFGITLDLGHPKGVELFKQLVKVSDAVVENYAYGVMERLGVGYEALREANPQIIMVSMPQFGNTGPYKHYRGWGNTAEAMAGQLSLRGYPDQNVEIMQGTIHTDTTSSSTAPFAVLAALYHRRRTGKGQFIDFGQAEAFMNHLGEIMMDYIMNGRVAGRMGNRHPFLAPHGCYPTQPARDLPEGRNDRWITLACRSEAEWQALRQLMGNPPWVQDPKFGDMLSRKRHEDELDHHLGEWTKGFDHYDLFHKLQAAGIPAGPVLDFAEAYADPHVNIRGFFEEVTHKEAGTHRYPGMPWRMSKSQGRIRMAGPTLGEHNYPILAGLLGLSEGDIAQLEVEQIIGTEFLPDADQ